MTDRELLELAAKAAGIDLWHEDVFTNGLTHKVSDNGVLCWNPLTDDGDALRLAVRLAMTVRQEPSSAAAGWGGDCLCGAPTVDGRGPWFWKELLSDKQDPLAATRRAITRAAAEIGKGMP